MKQMYLHSYRPFPLPANLAMHIWPRPSFIDEMLYHWYLHYWVIISCLFMFINQLDFWRKIYSVIYDLFASFHWLHRDYVDDITRLKSLQYRQEPRIMGVARPEFEDDRSHNLKTVHNYQSSDRSISLFVIGNWLHAQNRLSEAKTNSSIEMIGFGSVDGDAGF